MYDEETPEPNEELSNLLNSLGSDLSDSARKLGLYAEHVSVGVTGNVPPDAVKDLDSLKKVIEGDEGDVLVMATFAIGDVAYSKRIQDPEQDEVDDQVRMMLPDPVEEIREKLKKAQEGGELDLDAIFDIDLGGEVE